MHAVERQPELFPARPARLKHPASVEESQKVDSHHLSLAEELIACVQVDEEYVFSQKAMLGQPAMG